MRTTAITLLLSIGSIVCAAGICFVVNDSWAATAGKELAAFRKHAYEKAVERNRPWQAPGGGVVPSMVPPTISQSDRARIDELEFTFRVLVHRRDLAAAFFTRGALVAVVIAGFCGLLWKRMPIEPLATQGDFDRSAPK